MSVTSSSMERAQDWVGGRIDDKTLRLLLSPLPVGPVVLPNRFIMSAMGTRMSTPEGEITDRQIAYYSRRARGGTGTIIVEGSSVHAGGTTYACKPRLYDDRSLSGLARLASAIRAEGVVAGIQLMHAGRHTSPTTREGPAASVSGGKSLLGGDDNEPLDEFGILEIIEAFAAAAARACQAGFQLVEVHAAHGYLIHDFLSPLRNQRSDAWGRLDRRRFLLEVIRAVKGAIPSDAAVIVRLSSSEPEPGGITTDHAVETARAAEAAGANGVLVSGGNNENIEWIVPPVFMPFALYLDAAGVIKQNVAIPTAVVGRISTPWHAAEAVRSGKADLVVMGRALLADPDFVNKLQEPPGHRPIRPCIACNECLAQHIRDEPILCTVNPGAGRESQEAEMSSPSDHPRRILVVGAGPAGLLFSVHAIGRGHRVTLMDRQERVGGKLWLAAAAPYKTDEMLALYTALLLEAQQSGVDIRLGRADVAQLAEEVTADLVVLSSGASPRDDDIAGESASTMQAEEYLALGHHPGWNRVAILGAGDTACDAAARLATAGVDVWMLARGSRMARGIEPVSGRVLRRYLADLGVHVIFDCDVTSVIEDTVNYRADGSEHVLRVDQVLFARGVEASAQSLLAGLGLPAELETRTIGDAAEPGNFLTSLRSAWDLALAL